MKIGDLIKVAFCPPPESSLYDCGCFFFEEEMELVNVLSDGK